MQKTYSKNPDVVYRKIASEFILVPVRKKSADLNSIYLLNEIAGLIWELIDARRSLEEISRIVIETYDAGQEAIWNDLEYFLQQLIQIGAVQEIKSDGQTSVTAS